MTGASTRAALIDGKAMAARLQDEVAAATAELRARSAVTPGLAVVLVGEDPASQVYVRAKERRCGEAGIGSVLHRLPADTPEADLMALIARLNADDAVDGILVQFPLPGQLSERRVIEAVALDKDVDGFHPMNAGRLAAGLPAIAPCTPLGCLVLLRAALGDLSGREAVVVGRSLTVGRPMGQLLLNADCTVTVAHSRTRDLAAAVRRAEIVVAAAGRPRMIRGDWLRPGATVIDVGINRIDAGEGRTRLVGDVDFDAALAVAGAITPVPGGVGPMTIACLLANTLIAACRRRGLPEPDLPLLAGAR